MNWDIYEIRARIAPTVIICLPIINTLIFISFTLINNLAKLLLGSGVVLCLLLYGLSFAPTYLGRKMEKNLWMIWGGEPTTRFLRWRDTTFGIDLKHQIHLAVRKSCKIRLCSEKEEQIDPDKADEQIKQAFIQVKAIVRNKEPNSLGSTHNAEYGFHRNLLGGRSIWLIISIIGVISLGSIWYYKRTDLLLMGFLINISLTIFSIIGGWYFLPKSIKIAADRYAVSMWTQFLAISNMERKK